MKSGKQGQYFLLALAVLCQVSSAVGAYLIEVLDIELDAVDFDSLVGLLECFLGFFQFSDSPCYEYDVASFCSKPMGARFTNTCTRPCNQNNLPLQRQSLVRRHTSSNAIC